MKKKIMLLIATILMLSIATVSFASVELTDIAGTKYEESVKCLTKLEIVSGYPDQTFRPENKITRAEIAKILLTAKGEKVDLSALKDKEGVPDSKRRVLESLMRIQGDKKPVVAEKKEVNDGVTKIIANKSNVDLSL